MIAEGFSPPDLRFRGAQSVASAGIDVLGGSINYLRIMTIFMATLGMRGGSLSEIPVDSHS